MKQFKGFTGTFTVSKKCIAIFSDAGIVVTGSPSDIRKVCHVLDTISYKRMYSDAPIMREGRTYQVRFPETPSVGNHTYVVSRKF